MRIQILGDHLALTQEITDYATRRLETALGKFDHRLEDVTMRVSDVNGPRGGTDKRCRVEVQFVRLGGEPIHIDETQEDLYAAIDATAARAKTAVVRRIEKAKTFTHESASGQAGA